VSASRRAAAAVLASLTVLAASPLAAQCRPGHGSGLCVSHPDLLTRAERPLEQHALVLGINAAIGGVTAGLLRQARGGSFREGFAAGAAGGTVVYAGKWLSAEGFWGAGIAGRQVAAVGSSVIRNASEERGALDHLMLPVGPIRVYVDRVDGWAARPKLDLVGAGVLAWRAFSADATIDPRASLSAGTPVFMTETAPSPGWHGNNSAGVILLRQHDDIGDPSIERLRQIVFAHERIHLLQYDQALHTWSAPAEAWLLRRIPGGAWINRHVDVGLIVIPNLLLDMVIPYEDRPWEREADFFSGTP